MKNLQGEITVKRVIKAGLVDANGQTVTFDTESCRDAILLVDVANLGGAGTVVIDVDHNTVNAGLFSTKYEGAELTEEGLYEIPLKNLHRFVKVTATVTPDSGEEIILSVNAILYNGRQSGNLMGIVAPTPATNVVPSITTFIFPDTGNDGITGGDVTATIDNETGAVALTVPNGSTVTALRSNFVLPTGLEAKIKSTRESYVSGALNALDFTSPQVFEIFETENPTNKKDYTVTVTIA